MSAPPKPPGTRIRLSGRAINALVVHVPWLWPVLRAPIRRYFAQLAPGWDERVGAGSVDHLAALSVAVTRVDGEPERLLDVGTGTGEAALFLAREYPRASVRGVDLSEEMVSVAQGKVGLDPEGRVAFRVADAAALPYGEGSFDLVAQVNMPPFFAEVGRVLRPGGHAIVVASSGDLTPFYTPPAALDRGFARAGIERVDAGAAGRGTFWVGRRRGGGG
ncbi:MAG TPA: class I SAM-dependent methyltransferase [Solirubrobacterales bacterium]|nr:class I SAM-dependent methyltransferase [Solirubrobacterales bacterium]